MYNINPSYIFKNLYQNLYIAKKSGTEEDSNHNKVPTYEKPIEYKHWNIQYVKAQSEIIEFGEIASKMRVAVIPNTPKYANKFNEFDLAYLDGAKPYVEVPIEQSTSDNTSNGTQEGNENQNTNEEQTTEETPTTEIVPEVVNGQYANYRIYAVRPQNNIIKVYFLLLNK